MAIVENRSSEIGDIISIKTDTPVLGIIALNTFVDNTQDETASRFFVRQFRYSTNGGITFSSWTPLTNANLQSVSVKATDIFIIEYQYIRGGTDASGEIAFNDVLVNTSYERPQCGTFFDNSIFAQYLRCDDVCSIRWAVNVLEKVYNQGIVAQYVQRNIDNSTITREDEDYINFWFSQTKFFAWLVCFARVFETYTSRSDLALDFLKQRDIYVCEETEVFDNIQYLIFYLLFEISKRGTYRMFEEIETPYGVSLRGEFIRILCKQDCDDFIFSLTRPENQGWRLSHSSPQFREAQLQYGIIKNQNWFDDSSNIPVFGSGTSIIDNNGSTEILISGVNDVIPSGLGWDGTPEGVLRDGIEVNPCFDYMFTFFVKQSVLGDYLTFEVDAFDSNNQPTTLLSSIDGQPTNIFYENESLNEADRLYKVKAIIYGKDQFDLTEDEARLNVGFGKHLKFSPDVCRIIPKIGVFEVINPPQPEPEFDICTQNFTSGGQGITRSVLEIPQGYTNSFILVRFDPLSVTDKAVIVVNGTTVASTGEDANRNYGRPTAGNPNPTASNPGEFDPGNFQIYNDPSQSGYAPGLPDIALPFPNPNNYRNGDALGAFDDNTFGNYWYVGNKKFDRNIPDRRVEFEAEFGVQVSALPPGDQYIWAPVSGGDTVELYFHGGSGTAWNAAAVCPVVQTPPTPEPDSDDYGIAIQDLTISPRFTPWSNCFLNSYHFDKIWLENNNAQLTNQQLELIYRQKFVPYDNWFRILYFCDFVPEERPVDPVCEILNGFITDDVGDENGIPYIENQLIMNLPDDCRLDAKIDCLGNLVLIGENTSDVYGYFIDEPECELKLNDPIVNIQFP